MRKLLTVIMSSMVFFFSSSIPFVKYVSAKNTDGISSIQSSSPIYLKHANEIFNNADSSNMMAMHGSHGSHGSHYSHFSHESHASHYSSR